MAEKEMRMVEKDGGYSLEGMDEDGLRSLHSMIRGAGLCERRVFDGVKRQIENLLKI